MIGRRGRSVHIGRRAEAAAERFLVGKGLEPVARNYRTRAGEIDLVMRARTELVFVEVRHRRDSRFGSAAESIDGPKRRRLVAAALHYLQRYGEQPCRFDVVTLDGDGAADWIPNAFGAE